MKTPHLFLVTCSMLLALCASAAEVVVYSPYDASGLTINAPSGTYRYPAAYTGHRAVVTIPDVPGTPVEGWTGGGDFSPTAAYDTTAGRDSDVLDLQFHSPIMPRISLTDGSADRGTTLAGFCAELKRRIVEQNLPHDRYTNEMAKISWLTSGANKWEKATVDKNSTEVTRVRIVRWALNGVAVYNAYADPEIVLDRKMMLADRPFVTEADILADGDFDLDWKNLENFVTDRNVLRHAGDVTNAAYLVVIGDGKPFWDDINQGHDISADTNSCPKILDYVLERRYAAEQASTTPVNANAISRTARPLLQWTIDGEDDSTYEGYTAFKVQICNAADDTVVWTSAMTRLPRKDANGVYSWRPPLAAGDLAERVTYKWQVSVTNAKFPEPDFRLAAAGYFRIDTGNTGKINVCARYFGSADMVLDKSTVRVEAYTNAKCSGVPASRTTISGKNAEINSATATIATQATLTGLKANRPYYLRAYLDSDFYGKQNALDAWEPSGVYRANTNIVAASVAVATANGGSPCPIYIFDADTNGNGISDAYEMHNNGGSLDNGAINVQ